MAIIPAKSVTIRKVAELANVSTMTVSRVMNNGWVSAETRARVLSIIEDLNYQPDMNARSLRAGSSLIGMFVEYAVGSYEYDFQAGAIERCREAGMHLMLEPWNAQDSDLGDKITKLLRQLRLEAVILLPPHSDNPLILARLEKEEVPVVRIAPNALNHETPVVRMDDYAAARAMTEHLLDYGHRRIGFIRGAPGHRATEDRYRGFFDVMSEHNLPVLQEFVLDGNFSFYDGEVAAREMLTAQNRPTAIFTSGDDMAVGVFSVAQQLGLRLPDELSVTGFDDSPASRMTWPRLTTIRQPVKAMGWAAADMIIEHSPKRNGWPDPMPERLFEFELIARNSTAKLREQA